MDKALTSNLLRQITALMFIVYTNPSLGGDCLSTTPIWPNQIINASLDGSECLVSDLDGSDDYTYYDLYFLTLSVETTITITMESGFIDTFLALLAEEFLNNPNDTSTLIEFNDDANNSTTNSEITISLASGNYIIAANSFWDYETGSYTLKTYAPIDTDGDGILDGADIDDDNDGMPDAYEIKNGFNPLNASDASSDADSDGYSNLEEYIADSDPHDPNSIPGKLKFMPWLPLLLD